MSIYIRISACICHHRLFNERQDKEMIIYIYISYHLFSSQTTAWLVLHKNDNKNNNNSTNTIEHYSRDNHIAFDLRSMCTLHTYIRSNRKKKQLTRTKARTH